MPKFFFHVRDADGDLSCDAEGQELPDLAAARTEAIRANREMLGERLLHGGSLNHRQMEITDESGQLLAVIHAQDVLFQDGQLSNFSDDVTKSAPSIRPGSSDSKPPAR
jgi:hypothetical protein